MGLFDSLLGAAEQALGDQSAQGAGTDMAGIVTGMLTQSGHGGLATLVQQLQASGLGDHLQSWISTGANLPVSGDQISSALGSDLIGKLAAQAGVSPSDAAGQLSQVLPQLINHLSPNGQLPDAGALGGLLEQFLKR